MRANIEANLPLSFLLVTELVKHVSRCWAYLLKTHVNATEFTTEHCHHLETIKPKHSLDWSCHDWPGLQKSAVYRILLPCLGLCFNSTQHIGGSSSVQNPRQAAYEARKAADEWCHRAQPVQPECCSTAPLDAQQWRSESPCCCFPLLCVPCCKVQRVIIDVMVLLCARESLITNWWPLLKMVTEGRLFCLTVSMYKASNWWPKDGDVTNRQTKMAHRLEWRVWAPVTPWACRLWSCCGQ